MQPDTPRKCKAFPVGRARRLFLDRKRLSPALALDLPVTAFDPVNDTGLGIGAGLKGGHDASRAHAIALRMEKSWKRGQEPGGRSEADVARLVIRQTDQMIAMAVSMKLDSLLPTLERVREEAESVLATCGDRLAN